MLHSRSASIFGLSLGLVAWSLPAFAQQLPSAPYKLSELVQVRAQALNVWEKTTTSDFDFKAGAFPVYFSDPRAREPLQFYLDQLTAADVMANVRARARGEEKPAAQDYDLMFSSWCIFIPNKQPNRVLEEIGRNVRSKTPVAGLYLSPKKRELLVEAMQSVLRKGSDGDILKALGTIKNLTDYNSLILDTSKLK